MFIIMKTLTFFLAKTIFTILCILPVLIFEGAKEPNELIPAKSNEKKEGVRLRHPLDFFQTMIPLFGDS